GRVQDQFADREVEASVGGGVVVAVVNGRQEIVSLKIQPELVDPSDVEMLEEMVTTAVNLAMKNAVEMLQTEVNKITGGMNIPGLF
ncbi:MAG: DNA-binding YbaB/EbfC family protein, partial [Bradymonadia bacterium]